VLFGLAGRIAELLRPACLPRPVADAERPTCVVEYRTIEDGVERRRPIPRCDDVLGATPCWRPVTTPECNSICGPDGAPQRLTIDVQEGATTPPANTTVYVSCLSLPDDYACAP
jgi:hypothetical protein